MEIIVVPMNSDNYSYLIVDTETKACAAVDPCEHQKTLEAIEKHKLGSLDYILTTHDHWDHSGGNVALSNEIMKRTPGSNIHVVGSPKDKIPALNYPVKMLDSFMIGKNVRCTVLDTPCHTPGHVSFYCEDISSSSSSSSSSTSSQHKVIFTGDTMFIAGCGNFNKGTPKEMYHAMVNVLCNQAVLKGDEEYINFKVPSDTLVYPGHEYTQKNLMFALEVEPDNEKIKRKLEWATKCMEEGKYTVPSTIQEELETNPFVRCIQKSVQSWAKVEDGDPIECIWRVRQGKNKWGEALAAKSAVNQKM